MTIDGYPASFSDLITGMKVQISSRVISYGKKKNSNIHEAKRIRARHTKQSKKQQK